jgi:hypothetical protein
MTDLDITACSLILAVITITIGGIWFLWGWIVFMLGIIIGVQ